MMRLGYFHDRVDLMVREVRGCLFGIISDDSGNIHPAFELHLFNAYQPGDKEDIVFQQVVAPSVLCKNSV